MAADTEERPLRAASYARISRDSTGKAVNATTQEHDNLEMAGRFGYEVVATYLDNDLSAYRGNGKAKVRPGFTKMLADAEEGAFDVVVAWHDDRLWRDVVEQQLVFGMFADVGVVQVVAGGRVYDTSSADDAFISGLQALVAQRESADKSRRLRRKAAAIAAEGRPNGGPRPFGFDDDKITHRDDEAAVIRDAAKRLVAGESVFSIVEDWNHQGIRTPKGNEWNLRTFGVMMQTPRLAGLRSLRGEVVADAVWDAIIDRTTHERIRKMYDARREGTRRPRRYLLTGILRCGRDGCGGPLYGRPTRDKRRYQCRPKVDGGCNSLVVTADPVENAVRDMVCEVLSSEGLARALATINEDDTRQVELTEQLAADKAALEELSRDFYVDKLISRGEFLTSRQALESRIESSSKQMTASSAASVLTSLPTDSGKLREMWDASIKPDDLSENLAWRRALVESVIDHIVVLPVSGRGRNYFQPERLQPHWRV